MLDITEMQAPMPKHIAVERYKIQVLGSSAVCYKQPSSTIYRQEVFELLLRINSFALSGGERE